MQRGGKITEDEVAKARLCLGFVAYTSWYSTNSMGDRGSRQQASNRYSRERAALLFFMWVGLIRFQLQFPALSFSLSYTEDFYCILSTHGLPTIYQSNQEQGVRMRAVCHVPPSLLLPQSVTGLLYNPIDVQSMWVIMWQSNCGVTDFGTAKIINYVDGFQL